MRRRWSLIAGVPLLLLAGADYLPLGNEGRGEFWWSDLWGFFALFGLVACVVLIVVSKALGHYWLDRPEDYYDRGNGGHNG